MIDAPFCIGVELEQFKVVGLDPAAALHVQFPADPPLVVNVTTPVGVILEGFTTNEKVGLAASEGPRFSILNEREPPEFGA
jgi:hypothetical protein